MIRISQITFPIIRKSRGYHRFIYPEELLSGLPLRVRISQQEKEEQKEWHYRHWAEKKNDKDLFLSIQEVASVLKAYAVGLSNRTIKLTIEINTDRLRGFIQMPYFKSPNVKIAVFAQGQMADIAKSLGVSNVGGEDLREKIEKNEIEYSHVLATPDMMGVVRKVAKTLGPKGLMPNSKLGTLTNEIENAINTCFKSVPYKAVDGGLVSIDVGQVENPENHIQENIKKVMETIIKNGSIIGKDGNPFRRILLNHDNGYPLEVELNYANSYMAEILSPK
ncbi:ribosomal protein L1 [Rozella allomycis CSF55]|uniref:Ribosomal protein n=1 Tax=Rozella allomycis (strain CSF55) TaxID=988480 RepID=A0A075AXZ8_ROZAC|nr:Ribosomal protein L1, 3-layer alpha/beta-sandwich domain-containing protein [Rozella allomycis CSF55]RKP20372.1 ribosomal protein L1 [Rozella allomycis CSF55]|eukprot:EPZ33449.1 Ribosomal protein L1, 3-layer alpha/beta-sandwich domain-containing protein [Rozella allomycis CSF55]